MLALLRWLPIYPMFGHGRTRLQPAYVEDVAEAIARALQRTQTHAITFECGGPRVYSYEELLRPCTQSRPQAHLDSTPVRRLAGTGMDCRTAHESARHP